MIPKECKRLAEVDFPIAVASKHAARENSVRQGHPKTLHLWWARRPLGACRAILLSVLLPDPCDLYCPDEFKKKARSYLKQLARGIGPEDADLRQSLIKFIGDFSSWDRSADRTYLEICRGLVLAAHGEEPPLVVDPFAGGGSIPLEALRIGCEAFASDLNPVAYLISKALLDDIPRSGPGMADELRLAGQEIASRAEKQLAEFYPSDPDGAQPIAYLWARSIPCESTGCGTEIPLVRSFWLCKKAGRKRALRYKLNRPHGGLPWVEFEIFEPRHDSEVPSGTISQAKASCPCCHVVLSPERVRAQLRAQHGGADVIFDAEGKRTGGARLLAVVSLSRNGLDRNYRLPTDRDYEAVWQATKALEIAGRKCLPDGLPLIPDEPVVQEKVSRNSPFRMHLYGCTSFGDLFSSRQKLALSVMQQLIRDTSTAKNARTVLTLATGKMLRHWNAFTKWHRGSETVAGSFALQAISMAWDYPEMNPFSDYAGSIGDSLAHLPEVVDRVQSSVDRVAQVAIADAAQAVLPDASASCWFTDPPYYDAIPYADLSDFFYVWHKRVLLISELSGSSSSYPSPLTPKAQEIV
jgi:putative DNA methylase